MHNFLRHAYNSLNALQCIFIGNKNGMSSLRGSHLGIMSVVCICIQHISSGDISVCVFLVVTVDDMLL